MLAASTGLVLVYLAVEAFVLLAGTFENDFYQLGHQRFYKQFQPHPQLGYVLQPGLKDLLIENQAAGLSMHISSDSIGFTNPGKDYHKASVFFVGDSFTLGSYVPANQSFVGLVEGALAAETINLGQTGYNMAQYREIVEHLVPRFQPDTVVLCIFANDLWQLESPEFLANYYDSMGVAKYEAPNRPWPTRTFANAVYKRLFSSNTPAANSTQQPYKTATVANGAAEMQLWRGRGIHPRYFENGLHEQFEALFQQLLIDLKRMGVQPMTVFIPSKEACYADAYNALFPEDAGYLKQEADAFKRLWGISALEGVPFLDLTPAFRQHGKSAQLYFERDGHWNAAGHRLAAQLILNAFWNRSLPEQQNIAA